MTKRYFLDTNVLLRYFLVDSTQSPACSLMMQMAEDGQLLVATSSLVLLELHYVLEKIYGFSESELMTIQELILSIRNMQLCETTDLQRALVLHKKLGVKLSDCLVISQMPPKAVLVSYNEEFDQLEQLERVTPEMIVRAQN